MTHTVVSPDTNPRPASAHSLTSKANSIAVSTPLSLFALLGVALLVVLVTAGLHALGLCPILGLGAVGFISALLLSFLTLRGLIAGAIVTFFALRAEHSA